MKVNLQGAGGFCLIALWFAAVNGWRLLGNVILAAFVHEMGHYLVLRSFGAKITEVKLNVFGAVMETDTRSLSYAAEIAAVLAGPFANFLCAAWMAAAEYENVDVWIGIHVALGVFNLLPIRPLDGGRFGCLLLTWLAGPTTAEPIIRAVGMLVSGLLAAGLIYVMWDTKGSLWMFPSAIGFLSAAYRECCGKV